MTKQLAVPNINITEQAGWCLQFARRVFGLPAVEPTAWEAWTKTKFKHEDRIFPEGVAVPVWFDWWGDVGSGRQRYGHAAVRMPDGKIWSSPLSGTGRAWFASVDDLTRAFGGGMRYVGWSEDISGTKVIELEGEEDVKADNYIVQALAEGILDRSAADDKNLQNNIGGDIKTVIDTIRFYPEAKALRERARLYPAVKAENDTLKARIAELEKVGQGSSGATELKPGLYKVK